MVIEFQISFSIFIYIDNSNKITIFSIFPDFTVFENHPKCRIWIFL